MKTLKLFNAVLAKQSDEAPHVSINHGLVIESDALWAKDKIIDYYDTEKLKGNELNQTFHKSWKKIMESSRLDLLLHQIVHYLTTYGSDFQDEMYIPDEVIHVPEVKLKFKVIKALSKMEMTEKCLSLLKSGIALKEETINEVLSLLVEELEYKFTGKEGIRNKEAIIKLADLYNILPTDTMEFFRYIIYRATGQSLLIKNKEMVDAIKESNYNPSVQLNKFGLKELSTIFNRFKPLFLAFKPKCAKTINKIAKLSKKNHKPLITNPLNEVTSKLLTRGEDLHWLDNATPYALFKALSACYTRFQGQTAFVYRIRNGKSWIEEKEDVKVDRRYILGLHANFQFLYNYVVERFKFRKEINIYLPKNVEYALPTSEKMFVGNIPTGTQFFGEKLAVGVYWRNDWGANDLDISGINEEGKIGWNEDYSQEGRLMYSGDITNAPDGAVEYLYANRGLRLPTLVQNNVYEGNDNCEYKIIIGKGDNIDNDYMMNPNKLFTEIKCQSVQEQTILGIITPFLKDSSDNLQKFTLLNFGAGHVRVSGRASYTELAIKALIQQWSNPLSFNQLLIDLGANIVDTPEESDYDFSLNSLEKDSFTSLFKE